MQKTLGDFRAALLIGWVALSAAGLVYGRLKDIPTWAAVPVLAAFLFEYSFYLVPGFESVRERLEVSLSRWQLGLWMALSALPAYLVYAVGTGEFRWRSLFDLAALVITISFWYVVLPHSRWADIAFLVLLAAIVLGKFFQPIYPPPVPVLRIDVLGQLMLIRLAAMAMLSQRRMTGTRYGFIPDKTDWKIGIRHFLYFLVVGLPLAIAIGLIRFTPGEFAWWKAAGTFLGILWVVALSEEFFFRGLLQQWLGEWTGDRRVALIVASVLFGLVHLPFHAFPNWKMALVAAVAGWFYGRAFDKAHSIRASMVTHALVVTTWRAFFTLS